MTRAALIGSHIIRNLVNKNDSAVQKNQFTQAACVLQLQ